MIILSNSLRTAELSKNTKAFGFFSERIGSKCFQKSEAFLNGQIEKPGSGDFVSVSAFNPLQILDRLPGKIDHWKNSEIAGSTN